jgi:hypothetical protein
MISNESRTLESPAIESQKLECRTIAIELSTRDWQLLEAEAEKVNHPPEMLIKRLLEIHLDLSETKISPKLQPKQKPPLSETLMSLRAIAYQQPIVDAVQIARESREDLIQRGIF